MFHNVTTYFFFLTFSHVRSHSHSVTTSRTKRADRCIRSTHTHSPDNRNHVACICDTAKPVDCVHIFVFNLCNRNSCSSETMVWRMFYYIIIVVVSVQVSPVARINRSVACILIRRWKWKSNRFVDKNSVDSIFGLWSAVR